MTVMELLTDAEFYEAADRLFHVEFRPKIGEVRTQLNFTTLEVDMDKPPNLDKMVLVDYLLNTIDLSPFGEVFNDHEERTRMISEIGEALGASGRVILAVYLCSEAWVAKGTKDEIKAGKRLGPAPSERPDRQEIYMLVGQTVDQRKVMRACEIARGESGRLVKVEPINHAEDMKELKLFILQTFWASYAKAATTYHLARLVKGGSI